jgi:hypothetical protein
MKGVVTLRNVRTLHSLMGIGIIAAVGAVPIACSDDQFSGCEANRTCPSSAKGGEPGEGGEAGGETDTGGSAGSHAGGSSGSSGSSGAGEGGAGDSATGGSTMGGGTGVGGQGNEGGEGGALEPPDTTRPTIVSVSPDDGEIGVALDTSLIVTFSEPMDRTATQTAYQSQDIPPASVRFTWSADSTVLTIDPRDDLAYCEVETPSDTEANYYASIDAMASDASGNRLSTNFDWSFRTVRRVTQTQAVPFQNVYQVIRVGNSIQCDTPTNDALGAGDWENSTPGYVLVSLDLSSFPNNIVEWQAATLSAAQAAVVGTPFGLNPLQNLGLLRAYHMDVTPPTAARFTSPNLGLVGIFSTSPELTVRTLDVLVPLIDDYEHRTERSQHSQYRLSFDQENNTNGQSDYVFFSCGGFSLAVRYLVP